MNRITDFIEKTRIVSASAFLGLGMVLFGFLLLNPVALGADKLNVVTTTTILKSITESVGAPYVEVAALCAGSEDPHFLRAKPSFMLKVHQADLFIEGGLELEIGWAPLILEGARNPNIQMGQPGYLDASTGVHVLEVPTENINRSMGDVHPLGNPHYWMDPLNGKVIAHEIADQLALLLPEKAKVFEKNAQTFGHTIDNSLFGEKLVKKYGGEKLSAFLQESSWDGLMTFLKKDHAEKDLGGWLGKMLPYRGTKIIPFHASWIYFAERFGLEVAGHLEPKPGLEPTPRHLIQIIELIKLKHIAVILMEPFYPEKPADFVASKTGVKVVVAANAPEGMKGTGNYVSMMDEVVRKLVEAFQKVKKEEAKQ